MAGGDVAPQHGGFVVEVVGAGRERFVVFADGFGVAGCAEEGVCAGFLGGGGAEEGLGWVRGGEVSVGWVGGRRWGRWWGEGGGGGGTASSSGGKRSSWMGSGLGSLLGESGGVVGRCLSFEAIVGAGGGCVCRWEGSCRQRKSRWRLPRRDASPPPTIFYYLPISKSQPNLISDDVYATPDSMAPPKPE